VAVDWAEIDKRWQAEWAKARIFESDPDPKRSKCFVTFPFPYMSGPLHVGTAFTAARIDVYARYMRMRGYNVLFPWAWHWTGKPLAGAAERIRMGDESFIQPLRDIDRIPEEELKRFVDPAYMAEYYTDANREAVKRLGMTIDWRRDFHTSSLNPSFSRFVTWQYNLLRERGYVVKGTHPVVWCPHDQSPTGDHDRLEGEGVRPEEYTLMKFKLGDTMLPCATLRPETIYGVTNLWIRPDGDYVEADVDGERWIVSRTASEKLPNQAKKIRVLRGLKGTELVGRRCVDLVQGRPLLILPGEFVSTENGTGLVYSVPAHAPYDWLALRDLQHDSALIQKFKLSNDDIQAIKPISIISLNGYGEFPAVEIVDRMHIRNQNDRLAEEATKEIYKVEFHSGVLKKNCGPYAGERVADAKANLIQDLRRKHVVDFMYELTARVVCRCTTQCIAKVLEDQWFLKYSDPEWKDQTHNAIKEMAFYPEEARNWFNSVVDWLQDWPCARKTGLGTPLPWSPDWIVETLSDSTIYMAYYMVSKFVNAGQLKPEQLTPEFFNYIYYGAGNADQLCKQTGLDRGVLDAVRTEFLYWYPVDLRNSGKDLVGNHLTFYIFQHVALFERRFWPRVIGVNGFVLAEGRPMHRSQGNWIPMWKVCAEYGADTVRCTALLSAEDMDDPDWRAANARDVRSRLDGFIGLVNETAAANENSSNGHLENWLMGRLYSRAIFVSDAIEKLKTRTALAAALYDLWNDLRWYQRRATKPDSATLRSFLSAWIRLLTPFAPHMAEEAWVRIGQRGFVSQADWPKFDQFKPDLRTDELEELVKQTLQDTQQIIAATKIMPKKVHYYAAAKWKWRVYGEALSRASSNPEALDGLIRDMLAAKTVSAKDLPKYASKIVQQVKTMAAELRKRRSEVGDVDERSVLGEATVFFRRELKAEVEVHSEDDASLYDPKGRAKIAEPYRPAIFVE
jgi:leucyl-tRNA synthetase